MQIPRPTLRWFSNSPRSTGNRAFSPDSFADMAGDESDWRGGSPPTSSLPAFEHMCDHHLVLASPSPLTFAAHSRSRLTAATLDDHGHVGDGGTMLDWAGFREWLHYVHTIQHTTYMRSNSPLPGPEVEIVVANSEDRELIQAAIELGNRSKSTLGLMPFAGYDDAAQKGTLMFAVCDGRMVGYALYALARRRVRLVHLCVDPDSRHQGIAHQLVARISERHSDHLGIAASCRRDYNLGKMWIKLGFTRRGERRGRGKDGQILVDWWMDHQHPHLFTADTDTVLVRAGVDLNVLRDLVDLRRPDSEESRALQADHLVGLLELVRTAALDEEIDQMEGILRAQCTTQIQLFPSVRAEPLARQEAMCELETGAREIDRLYPGSPQDQLDQQHVADAIACGLNIFVTRDRRLRELFGPVAQQHDLRIMPPIDVVLHIDELAHSESYRPARLLNTSFTEHLIGSGQDKDLLPLLNTASQERPRHLTQILRDLALSSQDRIGVYGPSGDIVAAYSSRPEPGELRVPLLRVANQPLGDTLARQLLFRLRQQARDSSSAVIRLTDSHLSPQVRLAAVNEGYRDIDGDLCVYALAAVGSAREIDQAASLAARRAGMPEPPPLRSSMPAIAAAELERIWWPAKIIDSDLPTYLIPIQQSFSADLLGVPDGLLPRNEVLGLNREHVYYRSPGGIQLQAPARLLWYMSQSGGTVAHPAAVIACSQLDEVITEPPDELHSRFHHLGIWDMTQIVTAARSGRVQALRFTNTEVFPHPIPRGRLRELGPTHGSSGQPPQGPLGISSGLFAAIYQEGRAK